MKELSFTVPLIPVSVNHYKMKSKRGHWYVTAEAKAFKDAIAHFSGDQRFVEYPKAYELEVLVYLGKGQKGDGDNFWKVVADGLKDAEIIHSDAKVTDWIMRVRRDRERPRTEIKVREV